MRTPSLGWDDERRRALARNDLSSLYRPCFIFLFYSACCAFNDYSINSTVCGLKPFNLMMNFRHFMARNVHFMQAGLLYSLTGQPYLDHLVNIL